MSTAIERLKELPKHDLVKKAMAGINRAKASKEDLKRAGLTVLGGVEAAGGGAFAGLLAMKAERLGKTPIRSDLTIGGGIALLSAIGIFDDSAPHANAFAFGLIGAGSKDVTVGLLKSMGMTQSNILAGK